MRREQSNVHYFVQVFDTASQALLPPSWDVAALMRGQLSEKHWMRLRRQWVMRHTLSRHQEQGGSGSSVRLQPEFTDGLGITLPIITITTEEI